MSTVSSKTDFSQSVNLTHAWKASIVELKERSAHAQSSDWVAATESGSGHNINGSEITCFTPKRKYLSDPTLLAIPF